MIGVSLGDLIKLLDQVPGWKAVMGLPKRLKDLEERVAALEATPAKPPGEPCALCSEPMKVTAVEDHPTFGVMGMKQHTLTCSNSGCGHVETRRVDPRKRS